MRLGEDNFAVGSRIFEHPRYARHRPSSAVPSDPIIETSTFEISNYFLARGAFVDVRIRRGFELLSKKPTILIC